MTEDARRALGMAEIRIERFPFSVGRERRAAVMKVVISVERRMKVVPPLNDTCLVEATQRHRVSGEHFRIDFTQGKFVLTDRGSMCGTTVNGKTIGGQRRGGHTELHDQDEIAVGDAASQFVFEFRVDSVQLAADATVAPADPDSPGSPFRTTSVRIGARSSPRCTPPVAPDTL